MRIEFTTRAILKQVPAVPSHTISTDFLEVYKIEDLPNDKKVIAYTNHQNAKIIVLWEGTAYDEAGQWTDADVIERIKEIYETAND